MNIREENHRQLRSMRENFKHLREARDWSIKALSEISGINEKILADIEEDKDFDVQILIELCHFYHIEIHKIFFKIV